MTTTQSTTPAIQAFAFESQAVRVVHIDDQPWFVAKDVCECLSIANHWNVTTKLDDDEKGLQTLESLGGAQEMSVINESGLYATILRSQGAMTPGTPAHTFRKWVTAEVLPALRKTGHYSAPGADAAASLDGKLDRVLSLMEQFLRVMPKVLEAATPARNKQRKRLYQEDADRILVLRDQGYLLADLVEETDFSQTQCWCVITGRYKVLESGRVSIDSRSDSARAADAAAKAERAPEQPAPSVND